VMAWFVRRTKKGHPPCMPPTPTSRALADNKDTKVEWIRR